MTEEDWQDVIGVNLSGPFFMSKAALGPMVEQGFGRIVNVSSIIGQTGNIGQVNYAASKSGLFGLTMSLAKEAAFALARAEKLNDGPAITVNAIAPGFIETEMTEKLGSNVKEALQKQISLGSLGSPEDVANAALFLTSPLARYITGQVLNVDGGMVM